VLEPLAGYLRLAEALVEGRADGGGNPDRASPARNSPDDDIAQAWNFGPDPDDTACVSDVIDRVTARLGGAGWTLAPGAHPHEAQSLALDSARARRRLGWRPRWGLDEALERTLDWYAAAEAGDDMTAFTLAQIADHEAAA
jgi:CDP-glucose 4,6-dehydratase